MAFQDFDQISERRRQERQRKLRKRILIVSFTGIFCVALVVAAAVEIVKNNKKASNGASHSSPNAPQKQVSHIQQVIKSVCNSTMYKDECQSSLEKAVEKNPSATQTKDLLKFAITAINDEVESVSKKISTFQFNNPREKAAFVDCQKLIKDALEELNETISHAGGDLDTLTVRSRDMNTWLSAVMSYQETCIDGFPNGTMKTQMEKTFTAAKQLTSNSLAIVTEITSLLSMFESGAGSRRLLNVGSKSSALEKGKFPSWMSHEDRRMLKGADKDHPTPNVTVAVDGSGQFTTISAALAAMPETYKGRYIIYVKAGVYNESPFVSKKMINVTMYGDGSQKSIITGSKSYVDGIQAYQTATFAVEGDGFVAQALGFRNTAGPTGHEALAIRVQSDRAIFLNCRFEGYQGTLYAQTHRQFYRSCVITGTIDFIAGDASAVFQNCLITVRKPMEEQRNVITSQSRSDPKENTGFVLQNCKIDADPELTPVKDTVDSYLGRPPKGYSRTVIMESSIDDFINPAGFIPFMGNYGLKTLYYAEFNNSGPGASTRNRVKWPGYHVISSKVAGTFTVQPFIQGDWITAVGAPVHFGL